MADLEYISNSDLKEISRLLGRDIEKEFYNKFQLGNIIKITESLLSIIKTSNTSKNTKSQEIIYPIAMRFIYQLRTFLLDEEIVLSVGITSPSGDLTQKVIEQNQYLKNLRINLKEQSIEFSRQLSGWRKRKENKFIRQLGATKDLVEQTDLWRVIHTSSYFTWEPGMDPSGEIEGHVAYQKPTSDTDVWATYDGENHLISRYYGQSKKFFNYGWLYEWFSSMVQTEEGIQALQDAWNSLTPLQPLMERYSQDTIPGHQGGDYDDTLRGVRVQSKYQNNSTLASFHLIEKTLINISQALSQYMSIVNADIAEEGLAQELMKIFLGKKAPLNNSYDKIAENMINKLIRY